MLFVSQFDDGRVDLTDEFDSKSIRDFIAANRMALVTEFTQEAAAKIFGGEVKNHLLLFISKKTEDFKEKLDTYREAAPAFKGKVSIGCCCLFTFCCTLGTVFDDLLHDVLSSTERRVIMGL